MTKAVSIEQLEPGDVLLSLGEGKISRAIQALDGGLYSHAALWAGDGIVESTLPNVLEHPFDVSLKKHGRAYVDVYRHRSAAQTRSRIVEEARTFVGRPYASGELLLGAMLIASSTWIPRKQWQLKFLMDVCGFNYLLQEDTKPKPGQLVVCTELVVRAYLQAETTIHIRPTVPDQLQVGTLLEACRELIQERLSKGPAPANSSDDQPIDASEWHRVQDLMSAKFLALTGMSPIGKLPKGGPPLFDAGGNWSAARVTPRHLQTSPDLELVGRIHP